MANKITREELSQQLLDYLKKQSSSGDITIEDDNNHFEGTTLDKVLDELYDKFSKIDMSAKGVTFDDAVAKLGATNVQNAIEKVLDKSSKEIESVKAVPQKYTLRAAGWSGAEYSLEAEFPFAQYDLEVYLDGDLVTEQIASAYGNCVPTGSMTRNVIKASRASAVPKIDIPVILEVTKKKSV